MTDAITMDIAENAETSRPSPEMDGPGMPKAEPAAVRPEGLPDKFWDPEKGSLCADALANSYLQLEQKLGALGVEDVPPDPSGYDIELRDGMPMPDEEVNSRLFEAGFSRAQAQLVYDLAGEYLVPIVSEMAAEFSARTEKEALARHFGDEDRWREVSTQLNDWGKANLAEEVFAALSGSAEGIKTLHKMMGEGEPAMSRDGMSSGAPETEESLRAMMRDPKYWRDHDPAVVQRVRRGFQRLYPDEG